MSFRFGSDSERQLGSCDPRLIMLARAAIKIMDFTVLEGHRDEADQNRVFDSGHSKVRWPNGNHNTLPSRAFDLAPYPIIWPTPKLKKDNPGRYAKVVARFYLLAGVVLAVAWFLKIPIKWGGDWDGDWDLFDQTFDDLGHFELKGE